MMRRIDLNADIGEGQGAAAIAAEEAILDVVTSCSIACGGHAGDEASMRRTLGAAKAAGVAAGAHPSYPDRENFGRKTLLMSEEALEDSLMAQTQSLLRLAEAEGVTLRHFKPHGALYNDAARDPALAALAAKIAGRFGLALYGQPGSAAEAAAAGRAAFISEGFADRAYGPDGRLVPRTQPGAVIEDDDLQAAQAVALASGEPIQTSGGPLALRVATLCLHSDTPGAAASAGALRRALEAAGLKVEAPDAR